MCGSHRTEVGGPFDQFLHLLPGFLVRGSPAEDGGTGQTDRQPLCGGFHALLKYQFKNQFL